MYIKVVQDFRIIAAGNKSLRSNVKTQQNGIASFLAVVCNSSCATLIFLHRLPSRREIVKGETFDDTINKESVDNISGER